MEKSRSEQVDRDEALASLQKMVGKTKVAMLTTLTADQQLRSRPLHTERVDDDGCLWFVVAAAAPKVGEIHQHGGKVCLSYADPERNHYISLTGTAQLVDDPRLKQELWSATAEVWFPNGRGDPAVALLKVIPEHGEFWERPGTALGRLLAFARAAVTGNTDSFGQTRKFDAAR